MAENAGEMCSEDSPLRALSSTCPVLPGFLGESLRNTAITVPAELQSDEHNFFYFLKQSFSRRCVAPPKEERATIVGNIINKITSSTIIIVNAFINAWHLPSELQWVLLIARGVVQWELHGCFGIRTQGLIANAVKAPHTSTPDGEGQMHSCGILFLEPQLGRAWGKGARGRDYMCWVVINGQRQWPSIRRSYTAVKTASR